MHGNGVTHCAQSRENLAPYILGPALHEQMYTRYSNDDKTAISKTISEQAFKRLCLCLASIALGDAYRSNADTWITAIMPSRNDIEIMA